MFERSPYINAGRLWFTNHFECTYIVRMHGATTRTDLDWPGENTNELDKYTMVSGGKFAATYRATLANIILWTGFHIMMFIHIWMSIQWYEKKAAMQLNPEEEERAKAALNILRHAIALGKQPKRAPTMDEVDNVVGNIGRTS